MKKLTTTLLIFIFSISIAFTQTIPQKISYQGKLMESGVAVNGQKNFVFSFLNTAWTESHNNVQITNGLYSVQLGSTNPIPDTIFTKNSSVTLQIVVEGVTLSPQTEILSVAYAFKAEKAVEADQLGNVVFVDNEGDVGIGTTEAREKLDVAGRINLGHHSSGAGIWYEGENPDSRWFVGKSVNHNFRFYKDGEKVTIDTNGNVGIGITNPTAKLEIIGGNAYPNNKALKIFATGESGPYKDQVAILSDVTTAYGIAFFGQDYHRGGLYSKNIGGENNEEGEITLWSRAGNVILDAENVGISTTTPTERLEVNGNAKADTVKAVAFVGDGSGLTNLPSVTESDPVYLGSPVSNFTQTEVDNLRGNKLSNGTTPWLDATNGNITVVNTGNFQSLSVGANYIVQIEEYINLSSSYNELDYNNLKVHGGGFVGSGSQEIDFGNNCLFVGTHFKDVNLDIFEGTFVNCSFEGSIDMMPWEGDFINCIFNNVIAGTTHTIGIIDKSEINNCTFPRIMGITNSDISNSTIGGTATSYNNINTCTGNRINDSKIYLQGSIFCNNRCYDSKVEIPADGDGQITISNNSFDDLLTGESEAISIDVNSSWWRNFLISDNTFMLASSDPRSIFINNNTSGSYTILKISGNNFMRGTKAIEYSSNIRTFVSDNITRSTSLGVSSSGYLVVQNNYAW